MKFSLRPHTTAAAPSSPPEASPHRAASRATPDTRLTLLHRFTIAHRYPQYRNLELKLLLYVCAILAAYLWIILRVFHRPINTSVCLCAGLFVAIVFIVHLALRIFAPFSDPLLYPITFTLSGLGLLMHLRLDYDGLPASIPYGAHTSFAIRTLVFLMWAAVFTLLFLILCTNHVYLSQFSYLCAILGIILLVIPAMLPASMSQANGSSLWIRAFGLSFQPGELAKILLIIATAGILVVTKNSLHSTDKKIVGVAIPPLNAIGPILLLGSVSILIMLYEKDLGTALLIFITGVIMVYIATEKVSWLLVSCVFFLVSCCLCYLVFPHFHNRVQLWLHPLSQTYGLGYQVSQSLFGLGTGGLAGSGIGLGRPTTVPFAQNDFILSSFGEELGLSGIFAILILYALLIIRGFKIATIVRDSFGKFVSAGISTLLLTQITLEFCGVSGALPLTGLTSPLLSYGGSSLICTFLCIALLARISSDAQQPAELIVNQGSISAR